VPASADTSKPEGVVFTTGMLLAQIAFSPAQLGPRMATLTAKTSNPKQPMISCTLHGLGGGPEIDVQPRALDFGDDAGFRTVRVTNLADPMDPNGDLTVYPLGVEPEDGGPPGGMCAMSFLTRTLASGESIDVPIYAAPPGAWRVQLGSNDFDEQVVTVNVRAGP
jgi:hypothetical protein